MPRKDPEAQKQYQKEYKEKNQERISETWSAYYQKNKEKLKKRQKDNYWKNLGNYLFYAAKQRAIKYGLEFNIEKTDVVIPEICPVFGFKFERGNRDRTPSLDRIDPSKGYIKGNIAVISFRANRLKGNATLDEIRKVIDYLKKSGSES